MYLKKSALSIALTTVLTTSTSATNATVFDMDYSGLVTVLDPAGNALQNVSKPYYYDATWGYGKRTQISGSLQYDTLTGLGSATVNPFNYLDAGAAVINDFEFISAGGGLLIANMNFNWNASSYTKQVVLDASGLLAELGSGTQVGDVYDATSCITSGVCATPASNGISSTTIGPLPIGPVPVATSTLNTAGQTGFGTTLGQLSLGTDDGVGGSPHDNGPTSGFNTNFDMTSLTVTSVPVPAAVWLFGSGFLALAGVAHRRKPRC